jgi:hypothetical protein
MSLYLIPVADALPAIQQHVRRWPSKTAASPEKARDFIEMFSASNE